MSSNVYKNEKRYKCETNHNTNYYSKSFKSKPKNDIFRKMDDNWTNIGHDVHVTKVINHNKIEENVRTTKQKDNVIL